MTRRIPFWGWCWLRRHRSLHRSVRVTHAYNTQQHRHTVLLECLCGRTWAR